MKTLLFCIILLLLASCDTNSFSGDHSSENYRREMKNFVKKIALKARQQNADFIVVPQNGQELLTKDTDFVSGADLNYLGYLNGVGRENLFYGYNGLNQNTPVNQTNYLLKYLKMAKEHNLKVLVTDYCSDQVKIQDSHDKNFINGFISFQANKKELDGIPPFPLLPYETNSSQVNNLSSAENMLYLLNPSHYQDKYSYLQALKNSAYDLLIIDAFFKGDSLTISDVNQLKIKSVGGNRLVLAYLSIGEAEKKRYYWQNRWLTSPPEWLKAQINGHPNNYLVEYWDKRWQTIIADSSASYITKIVKAGFDGVYIDNVDSYENFLK